AEGGTVREVKVRDGQHVAQGEPLLVLGDVSVDADLNRLNYRVIVERASLARLEAQQLSAVALHVQAEGDEAARLDARLAAQARRLVARRAAPGRRRPAHQVARGRLSTAGERPTEGECGQARRASAGAAQDRRRVEPASDRGTCVR